MRFVNRPFLVVQLKTMFHDIDFHCNKLQWAMPSQFFQRRWWKRIVSILWEKICWSNYVFNLDGPSPYNNINRLLFEHFKELQQLHLFKWSSASLLFATQGGSTGPNYTYNHNHMQFEQLLLFLLLWVTHQDRVWGSPTFLKPKTLVGLGPPKTSSAASKCDILYEKSLFTYQHIVNSSYFSTPFSFCPSALLFVVVLYLQLVLLSLLRWQIQLRRETSSVQSTASNITLHRQSRNGFPCSFLARVCVTRVLRIISVLTASHIGGSRSFPYLLWLSCLRRWQVLPHYHQLCSWGA